MLSVVPLLAPEQFPLATIPYPRIAAIVVEDPARLDVDAIICPWNPQSVSERAVRDRIYGSAGTALGKAASSAASGKAKTHAFLTPGYRLLARRVLHVAVPNAQTIATPANSNIASYVTEGLRSASESKTASIAILAPPIVSERDDYAARRLVREIAQWCATNTSPFAIFLCCADSRLAAAIGRHIGGLADSGATAKP
ncbi:MAG: macro domain-containing protein [Rhodobacteraceae bacterium]|nr:macro domain-containing protein [Paracoccaceae bacterium]